MYNWVEIRQQDKHTQAVMAVYTGSASFPGRFGLKICQTDRHTQAFDLFRVFLAGLGQFPGRFGLKSVRQMDIHKQLTYLEFFRLD